MKIRLLLPSFQWHVFCGGCIDEPMEWRIDYKFPFWDFLKAYDTWRDY